MHKLKHKIHHSSEEGIKTAVEEINTNNHKVVKIMPLGLEDKFCVFYHEEDKTEAPPEDLKQYTTNPIVQSTISRSHNGQGFDVMAFVQQYWFFIAIAAICLLFYFYGGGTPDV